MDLQLFANGKQGAELYSVNWIEASLDETLKRLVPGATASAKSESGKVVYLSDSSNFAVIYDVEGDYFRIEDKRLTGKRRYVDINGNNVANIKRMAKNVEEPRMNITKSHTSRMDKKG